MKYIVILFLCISTSAFSQKFTREDTLRGSITPERAWWDLNHYDLSVDVYPDSKLIIGTNKITYTVLKEGIDELQIDLQSPMELSLIHI